MQPMANLVELSDSQLMDVYADAMSSGVITSEHCERLQEAILSDSLTEYEHQALNRIFHSVWRGWLRYGDLAGS